MEEIRCGSCRRLLARGTANCLEIKCPRCGTINHVRATSSPSERPRASDSESALGTAQDHRAARLHP
ncbi:Com family DNA-binding transcriptional regulator [Azospirillum sp. RWY-5-1]|uniref:Com family DNA-binding transcriptional regulator n=1 Tax=Azospirillum oleiclasticum TaxID=2735135 RepID=A0ABX2TMD2_9PROT|nr:Com family DNA-binding transcriptional regulator [Azospirillum oleiclasticum]NYZ24499.1 Com family DNA-binding transcriptional regulator [Azospirillum oleiclasticum]